MANFNQLQISGRGFDQIDRQRVGRPIVCRFASRLERIEMFPKTSTLESQSCIWHLRLICSMSFPPTLPQKYLYLWHPVASLGHFRFYGPSVEVNFTSLYLWVFMGLLEFSFTRSVPFLRAQQRQVFVARRRLPQRRWKPMWGNSDAGTVTKSIEFRRSQMSEMII